MFKPFFRHNLQLLIQLACHPRMYPITLGVLLGCLMAGLSHQPRPLLMLLNLGMAVSVFWLARKYKHPLLWCGFGVMAAMAWTWHCTAPRLTHQLPLTSQHSLIGTIDSMIQSRHESIEFDFKLSKVCMPDNPCILDNRRLKLRLNNELINLILSPGDELRVQAKIRAPHGWSNPGGRSQIKDWFLARIDGKGRILKVERLDQGHGSPRQWLHQKLDDGLKDRPYSGVIKALIMGVQSDITPEQWQVFRATGTSHLVAISGLHIGLVATMAFGLGIFFVVRRKKPSRYDRAWPLWAAFLGAIGYAALAGFSIPTQRAAIMVGVITCAKLIRSRISLMQSLNLACLMVLAFEPLSVFFAGFWLSFLAVFILGQQVETQTGWRKWLYPQLMITSAMAPLGLYFFSQTSLVGIITNLIAIPWMSMITVPLSLLGALMSSVGLDWGLALAHASFDLIYAFLSMMARLRWSEFHHHLDLTALLSLSTLIALIFWGRKRHRVWAPLLILVAFIRPSPVRYGDLRVDFLDIGQGTAIVLRTSNHVVLYDAGPMLGYKDAGELIIKPYLAHEKITQLNTVIISHDDLDHKAGFDSLNQSLPINQVLASNPNALSASAQSCVGASFEYDGVQFEIIHPNHAMPKKKNDQSCVLLAKANDFKVLLTGDIEQVAEQDLIRKKPDAIKADIVSVAHHGSKSSSSEAWLNASKPSFAVIQAGHQNPYRLPHPSIVQRFLDHGITLYDTSKDGMVRFDIKQGELKRTRWVDHQWGIWHSSRT